LIAGIKIILPPLPEQNAIAAFLEEKCSIVDSIIKDMNEQIDILNQYKKNIILGKVFGVQKQSEYQSAKIKYLCFMQSGDNLISEYIDKNSDYPVFGGNGQRGYYDKYNVEGDTILVGRQGALCGNIHHVSGKLWATDHAIVTKKYSNCDNNYLYYLLVSLNLNQYSFTSAQPGLAVALIHNLSVVIPKNISKQKSIAAYLDSKCAEIDKLISEKQESIHTMQDYKKSVIYEYTTGKKRVKGFS
jgi:type I restriction enzyme S subunit